MNDLQIGGAIRALRIHRGWTRVDVAHAAHVSPATISRLEAGHLASTSIAVIRRVFAALDARCDLVARWSGGELSRLLDAHHAAIVEHVLRRFAGLPDWITAPEVTYSIFGERGSIDIMAWHEGRRSLLIIEVKAALDNIGGLLRQVDRYRRLARDIVTTRGWVPSVIAVWVIVGDGRTARRRLDQLRARFGEPSRSIAGQWSTGSGSRSIPFRRSRLYQFLAL
jgi:transcriptional regulator with XRE-family HTH domain